MAENGKVVKVVGKVFLMIKNGPGFMVSQMHSLFNKVADHGTLELTYEIATNKFSGKLLIIWASRPNIDLLVISLSYTPPRCELNHNTSVIKMTQSIAISFMT